MFSTEISCQRPFRFTNVLLFNSTVQLMCIIFFRFDIINLKTFLTEILRASNHLLNNQRHNVYDNFGFLKVQNSTL
jgi:hypothetical protein